MKKFWLAAAALALVPLMATAGGPGAVRKQIESSMLVTGEVAVTADGRVDTITLDQPEKLPPGIVDFVQGQVRQWTFEPVLREGQAVPARSRMSVRVVGKKIDNDRATIGIRNAAFPGPAPAEGESVSSKSMRPPSYPPGALNGGATGTTYLVLKIDRDGKVIDAVVEQVNLTVVARESDMVKLRQLFTNASLAAARKWIFLPPTTGEHAGAEYWSARVPVDYLMHGQKPRTGYGRWQSYVPGPRQSIPWQEESESASFSPDALAEGGVYLAGAKNQLRLLTALDDG
jgi:hypothetical protein